jgi:hypothetical protein
LYKCTGSSHWGDLGIDGSIIVTWITQDVGCGDMDWTELAQDLVRWRALVNVVMNLRGYIKFGKLLD